MRWSGEVKYNAGMRQQFKFGERPSETTTYGKR
jgi:hypothetical protein